MCAPLALPPATDARYTTPFGAGDGDLPAFPPGTRAEVPSLDATLECRARTNGSWGWSAAAPGAWRCQLEGGGCEWQCQEDGQGRPFCTCPEGTAVGPDGRGCVSPCAELRCEHLCQPQGDRGLCLCEEGYRLDADGRSCADIDDCRAQPGLCSQECVNTAGGFRCQCFPGYTLVEGNCIKTENLCFRATCQQDCVVVNGTWRCVCFDGFAPDPKDPHRCVRLCNRPECPAHCDPHTGDTCYCPDGYILQEFDDGRKVCTDIDECEQDYCDGECRNLFGGYECATPSPGLVDSAPRGPEDEGSGDPMLYSTTATPVLTSVPPRGGRSPGTLVAIIVSTVLAFVAFVAAVGCLLKRLRSAKAGMDYKCQQVEAGVGMEQVRPQGASHKQKM
ncbi:PREDICTED: thrombomodulin [Gekko japonicus]|uniref:Thrombomodulin n=1 Tax=Gekko japonicus TaxID=146911 RepID=A0ABM1KI94_GEKJA|nr:PREDICTED: thrombomodulin [Gekko japonicus]